MARTKVKPVAKKASSSKQETSLHSNNNNNTLDSSADSDSTQSTIQSTIDNENISPAKPKSKIRRSIVEEKRENYMLKRFGKLEKISKKTYKSIKFLQSTTHTLIPKLPFARLIHELVMKYNQSGLRIQARALEAIQEAAELHIIDVFAASNLAAAHAKRKTVRCNDMFFVRTLLNWPTARY